MKLLSEENRGYFIPLQNDELSFEEVLKFLGNSASQYPMLLTGKNLQ